MDKVDRLGVRDRRSKGDLHNSRIQGTSPACAKELDTAMNQRKAIFGSKIFDWARALEETDALVPTVRMIADFGRI